MNEGYELLAEKDAMWAEMLEQVLKDNGVSCASIPVYGAGLTLRAGVRERLKIYVPAECMPRAKELMAELFPENGSV